MALKESSRMSQLVPLAIINIDADAKKLHFSLSVRFFFDPSELRCRLTCTLVGKLKKKRSAVVASILIISPLLCQS